MYTTYPINRQDKDDLSCTPIRLDYLWPMDEWTIKTPNPICRLFFKIDLLTDFAALCLTDFIYWRYIHSYGWYFGPSSWTVAPIYEGTILVYCCPSIFSLTSYPPPLPKLNVQFIQTMYGCEGGGGGVLNCVVYHILQEVYTLFLARFRTSKIATPP